MTFKDFHEIELSIGRSRDELAEAVVEGYLEAYPESASIAMGKKLLLSWTREELDELFKVMCDEEVEPRENLIYSGDAVKEMSPAFLPLANFIEDKMFVAKMVADQVWLANVGEPKRAQQVLAEIEQATLVIIRANLHYYADHNLKPGSIARDWRNPYDPAPSKSETAETLLTRRELEVVRLVAKGKTNGEIAANLNISCNTVKNHLARLFDKTSTGNRVELTRWAIEQSIA